MRWLTEQGIALVITLLVMTLLLIIASAFLSISSTETLISINERNRQQAFNLAEAGIERAIAKLNVDPTYAGTASEETLGFGTYTVTVTDLTPVPDILDLKHIASAAYVPNSAVPNRAMDQIRVNVRRGSPFQSALLGLDVVEVGNGVLVDSYDSSVGEYDPSTARARGHIRSNGDITLLTNDIIKGDVIAGGSVSRDGSTTITGNVLEGGPSAGVVTDITFPSHTTGTTGISPPTAYDTSTHDLTVGAGETVTLDPGTYSFNSITLGPDATLAMDGPVVLYLTGTFHATGGGVINTSKNPTNLLIYSSAPVQNAIELDAGTGEFYGAVYALDGEFDIDTSDWKFYGAVVAKHVDLDDNIEIHYDVALARLSLPVGKFTPVAGTWGEVFP